MSHERRFTHVAGGIANVITVLLVFVFSLGLGLFVHVGTPSGRRIAIREIDALVGRSFAGRVTVERLARLGPFGFCGLDVDVDAADGTRVLRVRGTRASIEPMRAVLSFLFDTRVVDVDVPTIAVDHVDANLQTDAGGALKLAHAFDPSTQAGRAAPPSGRRLRVSFRRVSVTQAWVHGTPAGAPAVDADLRGLRGGLVVEGAATAIDVDSVGILTRGMPLGANVRGNLEAHADLRSGSPGDRRLRGTFHGVIGGVPTAASAAMAGRALDAVVDVPRVASEHVRSVMTRVPLYEALDGHLEAHGSLDSLRSTGSIHVGPGRIEVDAQGSFGDVISAVARVEASGIDVRAVSPTAPASSLGVAVDVRVRKPRDAGLTGSFAVAVPLGRVGEQVVPRSSFQGTLYQNRTASRAGVGGHLTGNIDEQGAPIQLIVDAVPTPIAEELDFAVRTNIRRLDEVKRLGKLGPGRMRLETHGKLVLSSPPTVDAALHVLAEGLTRNGNHVDRAELKVLARGPVSSPALKTSLNASGLRAYGYRFDQVDASSSGLLARQDVDLVVRGEQGSPTLEAHADIETRHGIVVHGARASARRGDAEVALRIGTVLIEKRAVTVDDVQVDGLGPVAHASVRKTPDDLVVRATGADLELKRLAYIFREENLLRDGRLSFDVDLTGRRGAIRGRAKLHADRVSVAKVDGAEANIDVAFLGRAAKGTVRVDVDHFGFVDVRTDGIHVGGDSVLDERSWKRAWGDILVNAQLDLGKLAALTPADVLPVSRVSGQFVLEGRVARDSESDVTPEIAVSASTRGLIVGTKSGPVTKSDGVELVAPPRSTLSHVDPQLDARVDGTTGRAEIAARLVDQHGAIVAIDAKSGALPFGELLASVDRARDRLANVPVSITVVVPERRLDELPPWLRALDAGGRVQGILTVSGTPNEPSVALDLHGRSLRAGGMSTGTNLDADVAATYDGRKGDLDVHVRSREGEVLTASAHIDADARGAFRGENKLGAWTASGNAKLAGFPLTALAPLADRQVGGHLGGTLTVDGLHEHARAQADLHVGDLEVGPAKYTSGSIKATLDGNGLDASARLEHPGGLADLEAKVDVDWGRRLAPAVNPAGSTEATLLARNFRLATLLPFVQQQVSELDGNLDANVRVSVKGTAAPTMQGNATVSNGVLQLTALGEAFHAVRLKLTAAPDGTIRLEDASLSAPSGKVTATGIARLNGVNLSWARATATIDKKNAMNLDLAGVPLGTVYGRVDVDEKTSEDGKLLGVYVKVPQMKVDLPLTNMTSVQDLGKPKDEHVGYFMTPSRFLVLAQGPGDLPKKSKPETTSPEIEVKVHLGKNIEIRRGTTLHVFLEGDPYLKVDDKTVVHGQLRLRGTLTVQGKKFDIEHGTATFLDDPSNPDVNVTAGWTAQDGTRVYADFIGPLTTGKVSLRSEPPRPRNEIVSLILFGTADGSQATPYASPQQNTSTQIGTTAGGFATEGLSKGLDQLTGMDVTAGIDTSQSSNPRPEVEVQIAKDLSVQLAFVLGTPPPGMNPDTTYLSLDWRFLRNWSLEPTFGNLGSTFLDLVWQHRY